MRLATLFALTFVAAAAQPKEADLRVLSYDHQLAEQSGDKQ
jgi:hypothetical protein